MLKGQWRKRGRQDRRQWGEEEGEKGRIGEMDGSGEMDAVSQLRTDR